MSSGTQVHPPPASVPFGEALRFWLKLGFISFGGPAAQIAIMHFELVERRRWISERRFLHALNYCMLLPGPEAQQLATYLGWLMHRTWGGVVAGVLFVLPSLVILIALAWLYMAMGQHPWVAGVFAGLKPAVVALVLHAAWRIGTRVLHNLWTWGLAAAALMAMAVFDVPFPWVIAVAAAVGLIGSRLDPTAFGPPKPQVDEPGHASRPPAVIDDDTPSPPHARHSRGGLATVLLVGLALWGAVMGALVVWQGTDSLLVQMGRFFTQAALLTFGGAYAVLPYVYQGAVEHHQWVTAAQMMDGLALGETTPGPLIMVVAFVAFVGAWTQPMLGADTALASAVLAAVLVTFFTFLPSFVFILAGGPLVEATHGRLGFTGPLTAITAAVVGVIVKLGLFFAGHVFWPDGAGGPIDVGAIAITAAALVALFRFRVGVIPLLAACAAIGVVGSSI